MKKTTFVSKISVLAVSLTFSMAFANSLSKNCIDEFVNLPKTIANFDMEKFLKEVPAEVVKVKAQLKLPVGKPADGKKTDIGITVGCLKQFPESANAIAPILKNLSIEMAKSIANKSGAAERGGSNTRTGQQNSPATAVVNSKDVIHLRNGQEIKNATVSEVGVDEVKYKIGTRAVVYVVKKTDIFSISYADGEKEFFCNGILYNSTIHYCHIDGKTYSCGNKPYNPTTQSCSNNKIYGKCGDKSYNPETHFCHTDDQIYTCGNKPYNPETQACTDNKIYGKCGDKPYNPATHFCSDNALHRKCGNKPYNPETDFCHTDGRTYSCANKPYNPATHSCEWSNIFERR
jgi:ribosomal protein L37E